MHFTPRQRPALAVQREVAQSDRLQITQSGPDLGQQKDRGFIERRGQGHALEETRQSVDRQQHQVVDRQTVNPSEYRVAPARAERAKPLIATPIGQLGIIARRCPLAGHPVRVTERPLRVCLAAHAPPGCMRPQARTAAGGARCVGPVA